MKTLLSFAVFFLAIINLSAQTRAIEGRVVDSNNKPVVAAKIVNNRGIELCAPTDEKGKFAFDAENGLRFGIEKEGFELKWTTVVDGVSSYKVLLGVRVQELESIIITRQNSQEALDITNTNILDYQPLNDCILTLKTYKKQYYIGLDSLQKPGVSFPIAINRPKSFFFDCKRNAYVLSADSAYQFVLLDSGIVFLSIFTIDDFNAFILPCVSEFENRLVHQNYRELNKTYELTMYENQKADKIFTRTDELGYQGAWEASVALGLTTDPLDGDTLTDPILRRQQDRREVYGRNDTGPAFQKRLAEQEILEIRVDQGIQREIGTLARKKPNLAYGKADSWSLSKKYAESMGSYMIFTQPIQIKTYQIGNFMAVVDFLNDSVIVLDQYGYRIKASTFHVDSDVKDVFQDKATGCIYIFTRDHGNHKLFGLDAFTGEVSYLKNFQGLPNTENPVIYDSYLYYKVLDRGYFGLERVRLPRL